MNKKRAAAIIGLILIAALYLATLIFALIGSPFARSCLMASLFCTIVIPVMIYAYLMLLKMTNRTADESADTDLADTDLTEQ